MDNKTFCTNIEFQNSNSTISQKKDGGIVAIFPHFLAQCAVVSEGKHFTLYAKACSRYLYIATALVLHDFRDFLRGQNYIHTYHAWCL